MGSLLVWLQRVFGRGAPLPDDHLTGAIDLSDAAYCMSLLGYGEHADARRDHSQRDAATSYFDPELLVDAIPASVESS